MHVPWFRVLEFLTDWDLFLPVLAGLSRGYAQNF